jgi:hypothetical protein
MESTLSDLSRARKVDLGRRRYDSPDGMSASDIEVLYQTWKLDKEATYEAIMAAMQKLMGLRFHKQNFRRSVKMRFIQPGYLSVHLCHIKGKGRPTKYRFEVTPAGIAVMKMYRDHGFDLFERLKELP